MAHFDPFRPQIQTSGPRIGPIRVGPKPDLVTRSGDLTPDLDPETPNLGSGTEIG